MALANIWWHLQSDSWQPLLRELCLFCPKESGCEHFLKVLKRSFAEACGRSRIFFCGGRFDGLTDCRIFFMFISLKLTYFRIFYSKRKKSGFLWNHLIYCRVWCHFELAAHVRTSKLRFLSLILRVDPHRACWKVIFNGGSPPSFRMWFFEAVRH